MAKGPGGFSVGRVSIQVVPDTSNFRQKLLAELKKEVKGIKVEIPVDLDVAKAVSQLKALDAILKRIDGRNINIGANVNSKGDLETISRDLSKVGKSASDAAGGFSRMGRMALILTAVVLLLAPALALIATLLAGLPSLMFAFGFAALAVGLGIEGIKKAASGFAPTIERLKKSLSKTFADQLTRPFIELNKIAPVLDSGLNKIAVSLSGIIAGLIQFVTSGQGMAQLNDILQNTAKFFQDLTPAITDAFRAFMFLASEASQEFGGLAATMRRFSAGFLDVVKRVTEDGTLGSALRNLNMVLDSLLEAFNRFFEAGLQAMTVLGGPMTQLFVGFTDAIVALMPILTALSSLVFTVLGEAFKQLAPIFKELTPVLQILGEMLSKILVDALRAIGPLLLVVAQILSEVLLKALTAIGPFIGPLLAFFTQLAQLLGEALLAAFTALSPFLTQFFTFLQQVLTALTPLMPMILELATVALRALVDMFVELSPELLNLGSTLFPQLLQVITDLIPVMSRIIDIAVQIIPPVVGLATAILGLVIPAMSEFLRIIEEVWPSIQQIIDGVLTHIEGIINVVMGIITGDWERAHEGLGQILEGAWEAFKGVVKTGISLVLELIAGIPGRIASALFGLPAQFAQSGRAMMQGMIDGITGMAQSVIDSALSVVNQVRDLLPFSPAKTGPFSGTGYTLYSGRALMEDWARGIQQGAPEAVRAMEDAMSMTQQATEFHAAVTSDGFSGIGDQVAKAIEGMEIKADGTNIARVVNKTNNMNARR